MATAHKVMVTVRNKGGQVKVFPYSTTDINAAFFLLPSGADETVLSVQDCHIVDIVHSAAHTTTKDHVFFNNVLTPNVVFSASCLVGQNRQIPSSPIPVPAGTVVKFQTIT